MVLSQNLLNVAGVDLLTFVRYARADFITAPKNWGLTLMKLRLGLADRFKISTSQCSKIINTWLVAMRKTSGHMVFWPKKEQVRATKPQRFWNLPDIRSIIDCTEIFIKTPKDPVLQCVTWSEYKHHNALKVLIGIAPLHSYPNVTVAVPVIRLSH